MAGSSTATIVKEVGVVCPAEREKTMSEAISRMVQAPAGMEDA